MSRFKRNEIMTQILFIGIDPGASGAIAVIDRTQKIYLLQDFPGDEVAVSEIIRNLKSNYSDIDIGINRVFQFKAAIERVHSMPGQGVSSSFKFGTNYGIWKGILASFQIPFHEPSPQAWQKGVIKKAQDKIPALAAARRIWPFAELTGPRGGAKDGRADALLIADWCRKQYI